MKTMSQTIINKTQTKNKGLHGGGGDSTEERRDWSEAGRFEDFLEDARVKQVNASGFHSRPPM